jgi:hypothetical protein
MEAPPTTDQKYKNRFLALILLFCIFFLAGCQQKGWIYRKVVSDSPQFNSAQWKHVTEHAFNGIEVQFLKGDFGTLGFLNVYSRRIPSGALIIQIESASYPFTGIVMEGGQRLLLPDEATETILQALRSGQKVWIYLDGGYSTEISFNR